jgi:hypothetical protein
MAPNGPLGGQLLPAGPLIYMRYSGGAESCQHLSISAPVGRPPSDLYVLILCQFCNLIATLAVEDQVDLEAEIAVLAIGSQRVRAIEVMTKQ